MGYGRPIEETYARTGGKGAKVGERKRGAGAPRVLIADSDPLARRVVRDAVQDDAGFVVPAEASTGIEAVELARYYRPELALLEIALPEVDGIEATRRISKVAPEVRIVIFSFHDSEEAQLNALRAGACGFVSKEIDTARIPEALWSAMHGEAVLPRKTTMRLIECLRALPEGGIGMRPVTSPLTAREWEVLDLMTRGDDTKRIAEALVLSEDTVYSHVKNLLRKLGVHSRREAVRLATELRQPITGFALEAGGAQNGSANGIRATSNHR